MFKLDPVNYFYTLIKNKPTVPRWFIFIIDLCICAIALIYAYLLRFNFDYAILKNDTLLIPLGTITILNIVFFLLFRTHEGIIRLSSAREGVICVSAVFSTSVTVLLSIGVSAIFHWGHLVPFSVIVIYFFMASFLIFTYRLLVKELYHRSLNSKFKAEKVIVYGVSTNGALIKRAIEAITGRQYRVIAFVDENPKLWGKSIDTIKIYSLEQAKSLAIKSKTKYLFLASDNIDITTKNEIADFCLAHEIGIKIIPAVQKWADGALQTRQLKNLQIEDLLNRPSIKLAPEKVQKYLAGKRILITGAAGSIGSEIVKQLAGMHVEQLILCDNRETGLY
ncbi:MAG: polysaccharide biosynthesis protein, partial [Bacteroidota bacterium]|nr:polysaccharide biosynthesis protein [Bacteroidota bacterium]